MGTDAGHRVPAESGDLRLSGENSRRRRMDRQGRHIVRDEIEKLRGPLDRWDTAAIAAAQGGDRHAAFVGERYDGPLTAPLEAAVLRERILRIYWQADEPPPQPPQLLDVQNIVIA